MFDPHHVRSIYLTMAANVQVEGDDDDCDYDSFYL